ncbi:MAG: isoprenylcysteine carboxylmethyltransferase family protein [Rhizobiaceae bacterium]
MTDIADRPNRVPWPPIVYLVGIAASIWLGILYPLPWFGVPFADILFALSFVVFAAVAALYVTALRAFARAKTTVSPTKRADHMVTNGPFALSRNPLYLANTLLLIGGGLVAGNPWFFVFALACALVTHKLAIQREERHLEARFGKRYRDYAKKVRRWI